MTGLPRRLANSYDYAKLSKTQHRAPMIKDLVKKDRKGWFFDQFGHRYVPWTEFERKEWADLYKACLTGLDVESHGVLWVIPDKKAVLDRHVPAKGTLIGGPVSTKKLEADDKPKKQLVWEARSTFMYATPQCTYPRTRRTAYIVVKLYTPSTTEGAAK